MEILKLKYSNWKLILIKIFSFLDKKLKSNFDYNFLTNYFLLLTMFPVVSIVVLALGFIVNIPVSNFHFFISIFLSILGIYLISQISTKKLITLFFFAIISIILFIYLSMIGGDFGWDSKAYHYPAIISIAEGWNPFYENIFEFDQGSISYARKAVATHTKGQWFTGAVIVKLFNIVESSNYTHLLFILSSFFVVHRYLKNLSISKELRLLIALTIAFNPVATSQLFSGYVDGVLYSVLVIFLFSNMKIINNPTKEDYFFIISSGIFLSNVKITGAIFTAIIASFMIFFILISQYKFLKKYILIISITAVLSLFVGFDSYVKDTFHGKGPVIQLIKKDKIKDKSFRKMLALQEMELTHQNRFQQFIDSQILGDYLARRKPITKFTVKKFDYSMTKFNNETNTFGPLYAFSFIASIIFIPFIFFDKEKKWFMVLLLILVFHIPSLVIGRYFPQAWIIPILTAAYFLNLKKSFLNNFAKIIIIVLSVNSLLILITSNLNALSNNFRFNTNLFLLSKKEKKITFVPRRPLLKKYYANKFNSLGINYSFQNDFNKKGKFRVSAHLKSNKFPGLWTNLPYINPKQVEGILNKILKYSVVIISTKGKFVFSDQLNARDLQNLKNKNLSLSKQISSYSAIIYKGEVIKESYGGVFDPSSEIRLSDKNIIPYDIRIFSRGRYKKRIFPISKVELNDKSVLRKQGTINFVCYDGRYLDIYPISQKKWIQPYRRSLTDIEASMLDIIKFSLSGV